VGTKEPTTTTICPNVDCQARFDCDACLHAHLLSNYAVGWADVFGKPQDAYVHFCARHAACTPAVLAVKLGNIGHPPAVERALPERAEA